MPRDKEALKSGLTSYMRSLQQCLAKVRTFFRAPQSDMLPDITMLRISAQVSRDKADRKPDNLFKNNTTEPLKGGVNVCILDPPVIEAPITVAPVEISNHSTLKLEPDPAERLTVKLPPFGAKARYCAPGLASM